MHLALVFRVLGQLCLFLAVLLLVPTVVAWGYGDGGKPELLGFLVAAGVAALVGLGLRFRVPATDQSFGAAEGFACVTLGWSLSAAIGAIPYWVSGATEGFTDAYFESMSGFTTTGASILRDVEVLPHGILFWRSFTQWLGGMGIVALFVAILPALGAGGNFLFQAEVPGPTADRLTPRISQSAKLLWLIYLGLTVVLIGLLWALGMSPFEALCHAFATCSTGGFSTSNASLGGYSAAIQWVVTVFMFLCGINFTMHFLLINRDFRQVRTNPEVRLFVWMTLAALLVTWLAVVFVADPQVNRDDVPHGVHDTLRHSAFNVVSVMTTTGFASSDFDRWPDLARVLLVVLMVFGACAGSTAGGMKMARVLVLWRYARRELLRFLHPSAVMPIKIAGRSVPEVAVRGTVGFLVLFGMLYFVGVFVMLALGADSGTALSSVIACLSNIGPGLNSVGPAQNYADIHLAGKWMLSAMMLCGRLEVYAVLLLFLPKMWRK